LATADTTEELLETGAAALKRGDWSAARAAFESVLGHEEVAAALEGLGRAAWWLDDLSTTFPARERAFQLYREAGDPAAAARVAISLALDYLDFQGEVFVCQGWLQRAESLLEPLGRTPELGWLRGYQGVFAQEVEGDLPKSRRLGVEAGAIGRELGIFDLQMMARAIEGHAMVREGEVRAGMQLIDEATTAAMAGEINDLTAVGAACCSLIYACESIADYERAAQWSAKAKEFCRRWGLKSFFSICRVYYANVQILRGDWAEAERELEDATADLSRTRPAVAHEARARLAELRRRQGRFEEAEALFLQTEPNPMGQLGRARLALAAGDAAGAADLVDRFLRRISGEDRAERAFALGVLLQARLALADVAGAETALAELEALARLTETPILSAMVSAGRAQIAVANADADAGRRCYEDALDLFQRAGAPYEAGIARIGLAESLQALGRVGAARQEARQAFEALRKLGARRDADRALTLLRRLDEQPADAAFDGKTLGLSSREVEVMAMIARGRSNQDIANELVLSIRTVERHISSIYEKLGLHGATARTAAAAYALGHGIGGS
jgi:ATP/maltotriose-dependent transcriptional regulator MalT